MFAASAAASSCSSVASKAVVKRASSIEYFSGMSSMMTPMECAASKKPDVSAMVTDINRKMPRYFPRLFFSSRGKRLRKGDAMARLLPGQVARSHALDVRRVLG